MSRDSTLGLWELWRPIKYMQIQEETVREVRVTDGNTCNAQVQGKVMETKDCSNVHMDINSSYYYTQVRTAGGDTRYMQIVDTE